MIKRNILIWSTVPSDGTSFYRGFGPWSRVPGVELTPFCGQSEWQDLIKFDAAVIQRPVSQLHVRIIENLKTHKIPVIVDYDDDVFNIPEDNQVYPHYQKEEIVASVKACFNLADVVTVSTIALKKSVLDHCPKANIVVVPNAIDNKRFKFKKYHKREKTILMRGGSSHGRDWGKYENVLVKWFEENPEWSLSVMGFTPHWMNQIKNIKAYEFLDIGPYFELLESLNPSLMLVPLEDTKFNHSKSNIAQLEGLIAGAPCLAYDLPEFEVAETFKDEDDLYNKLNDIVEKGEEYIDFLYRAQSNFAPLLSQVNDIRLDILETIKSERKVRRVLTAKEFHEYGLSHGYSNDFPDYDGLTTKLAEWICKTYEPKVTLELGAGNGGLLIKLLKRDVYATGIEINPEEARYFQERYPAFRDQMVIGDITTEQFENDGAGVGDLIISTEVFEHINKPDEWFVEFLRNLATQYRNFFFTSTPFHYLPEFDNAWGHCNIKLQSRWKKIFEEAGWAFVGAPKVLTNWDLQFKSTLV